MMMMMRKERTEATANKTDKPAALPSYSRFGHKYHSWWMGHPSPFFFTLHTLNFSVLFLSVLPLPHSFTTFHSSISSFLPLLLSHFICTFVTPSTLRPYTQEQQETRSSNYSHYCKAQSWVYRSMTLSHSSSQSSSTSSFERFVPAVRTKCQSRDL